MNKISYIIFIGSICILLILIGIQLQALYILPSQSSVKGETVRTHLFPIQSIDTMKYSRDAAGQALTNLNNFGQFIDTQMSLIEKTGATHVAIDTPYDAKFLPVLKLWVSIARAHHLSIWYRGN